jgi:hypothetical protein
MMPSQASQWGAVSVMALGNGECGKNIQRTYHNVERPTAERNKKRLD